VKYGTLSLGLMIKDTQKVHPSLSKARSRPLGDLQSEKAEGEVPIGPI